MQITQTLSEQQIDKPSQNKDITHPTRPAFLPECTAQCRRRLT